MIRQQLFRHPGLRPQTYYMAGSYDPLVVAWRRTRDAVDICAALALGRWRAVWYTAERAMIIDALTR